MAMDRWNPFREMLALREAMDRMFDDGYGRSGTTPTRASTFPVDLTENDGGFVLRATLPGVKPDDVQITIHGDTLTIRGQSTLQEERKDENWIIREQRSGAFHRMLTLPAPVDPEQAQARFENGILELTLPRAERSRPRQIKVSGGPPATVPAVAEDVEDPQTLKEPPPPPEVAADTQGPAVQPEGDPSTPADKDPVTQSSEESMGTSDPPSWTRERT